jgi:hypothetical protein
MRSLSLTLAFLVLSHVAFVAGSAPVVVSVMLAPFTMLLAWSLIGAAREESKWKRGRRMYRRMSRKAGMIV